MTYFRFAMTYSRIAALLVTLGHAWMGEGHSMHEAHREERPRHAAIG